MPRMQMNQNELFNQKLRTGTRFNHRTRKSRTINL
jgi:hypothetical protein